MTCQRRSLRSNCAAAGALSAAAAARAPCSLIGLNCHGRQIQGQNKIALGKIIDFPLTLPRIASITSGVEKSSKTSCPSFWIHFFSSKGGKLIAGKNS